MPIVNATVNGTDTAAIDNINKTLYVVKAIALIMQRNFESIRNAVKKNITEKQSPTSSLPEKLPAYIEIKSIEINIAQRLANPIAKLPKISTFFSGLIFSYNAPLSGSNTQAIIRREATEPTCYCPSERSESL